MPVVWGNSATNVYDPDEEDNNPEPEADDPDYTHVYEPTAPKPKSTLGFTAPADDRPNLRARKSRSRKAMMRGMDG